MTTEQKEIVTATITLLTLLDQVLDTPYLIQQPELLKQSLIDMRKNFSIIVDQYDAICAEEEGSK